VIASFAEQNLQDKKLMLLAFCLVAARAMKIVTHGRRFSMYGVSVCELCI
jgi:hypothetical protein